MRSTIHSRNGGLTAAGIKVVAAIQEETQASAIELLGKAQDETPSIKVTVVREESSNSALWHICGDNVKDTIHFNMGNAGATQVDVSTFKSRPACLQHLSPGESDGDVCCRFYSGLPGNVQLTRTYAPGVVFRKWILASSKET